MQDAPFAAQMLLARMMLSVGHEQSTAKGTSDGKACEGATASDLCASGLTQGVGCGDFE